MGKKVIILVMIIISFSCKKEPTDLAKDITGHWEWFMTISIYPYYQISPETCGIQETLEFTSNQKWIKKVNDIIVDSGTYSTGHGIFNRYPDSFTYMFDSVLFVRFSADLKAWDYYDIHNDTLQFCPGYAGKFYSVNSFNLPDGFNGSKFWIKK